MFLIIWNLPSPPIDRDSNVARFSLFVGWKQITVPPFFPALAHPPLFPPFPPLDLDKRLVFEFSPRWIREVTPVSSTPFPSPISSHVHFTSEQGYNLLSVSLPVYLASRVSPLSVFSSELEVPPPTPKVNVFQQPFLEFSFAGSPRDGVSPRNPTLFFDLNPPFSADSPSVGFLFL